MRKQIDIKETLVVGYLKKTHGVQGDLLVAFDDGVNDDVEHLKFLFFEIDGLLVPFFIDKITPRADGTFSVKFDTINSKEKANQFVGCKLALNRDHAMIGNDDFNLQVLLGYTLIDKTIGVIGEVIEVNDFGGNIVLSVNYHHDEVMIPFNEDLIISFDQETLTLVMECPQGLFDLSE